MDSTNDSTSRKGYLLRKSRSGCRDCRLRKVKCDEIRPVCSNCRRRYISIHRCDWGTEAPRSYVRCSRRVTFQQPPDDVGAQSISSRTKEAPNRLLSVHSRVITDTIQWRTLELRLMYHYATVVSHTMPDCVGAYERAWQQIIPQLSFESEVVLNPMLALSALHLHAHSPNDFAMAIALRRYLDRALADHRQALSNGEEISEQLWLSAVLLSHIHWLLSHQKQPDEAYRLPLQAFKMLEGTSALFIREKVLLKQLGYDWIGNGAMPHITPDDEVSIFARAQIQNIHRELTHLLDAFSVPTMPENNRNIYMEAKNYVLNCYRAFYSGAIAKDLRGFIGFMPLNCQPGYLRMLERDDPLAMALMARMLVLLSEIDHAWWLNGEGDYEVVERDIRGICDLMPVQLRWVMEWPCKVLDGKVILKIA